jgi:hypothetical protein
LQLDQGSSGRLDSQSNEVVLSVPGFPNFDVVLCCVHVDACPHDAVHILMAALGLGILIQHDAHGDALPASYAGASPASTQHACLGTVHILEVRLDAMHILMARPASTWCISMAALASTGMHFVSTRCTG